MKLSPEGARVIGSLVEKDLTTPDQYPLTIKSLVAACNQASNREPVVAFEERLVLSTLDALKEQRLVRFVLPSHGRSAVRYRHVLPEALGLDQRQCALVASLLLRGPQTIGELRSRTERMADFDGLEAVEHELAFLAKVEEPLALSLGRRPGQKEVRWICPAVDTAHEASSAVAPSTPWLSGTESQPRRETAVVDESPDEPAGLGDVDQLRIELAELRSEIRDVRHGLQQLRESLGE
jgi:uncharacterized protein YceH (UPF0502 family)